MSALAPVVIVFGVEPSNLPPYKDFLLPVLQAVQALGGTAHAKEITTWIVANLAFDDESVGVEYANDRASRSCSTAWRGRGHT